MTGGLSVRGLGELSALVAVGGGAAMLYALPGLFNAARLWLRNGTLERRLEQVGRCLLAALASNGMLTQGEAA